ncbi:universal stress protein [Amycolatopsis sp. K13G38]|uniref:Universal stress protein n=1 Tax=Amycolatopsis acididurans TaxID=2724524 RepID=A0ABX1IX43_9PSEU|nr:universal stress protein [Amycolatopsis acididurans]NKQ52052.1 universal stress protein [Amycolatopsis acididurans]
MTTAGGGDLASVRTGPVAVGVDGSGEALDAVRWAATEAARRKLPLRIVHACVAPAMGREWLREAATVAAMTESGQTAETVLRIGDPVENMIAESVRAAILIVAARGLGSGHEVLLGTVARRLTGDARCPLVVVRGRLSGAGPVLVGVDGAAEAALSFGFDEADLRATTVTALQTADEEAPGRALALAERLRQWERRFPGVPSDPLVITGNPGPSLMAYGTEAQLIVIGRQAWGLGATSQALVRAAPCPVAIVRDAG